MPRRNLPKSRRLEARRTAVGAAAYDDRPDGLRQKPKRPEGLLPMVRSDGTCPTGKIRYGSAEDAEEALRRALLNREILQSPRVEERWYPQPGDVPCVCQGYHLTHSRRWKR